NGTISDINGGYTLNNVPENGMLVFSFIGMKTQEVAVTGRRTINIEFEEEWMGLDEVVVVGYGTQRKSDITGSVTSVPSERLRGLPVTNIMQAVQGSVPGVNISQISS